MNLPQRKPTRLKNYDYSQNGYYFITICTKDKRKILCDIVCNNCGFVRDISKTEAGDTNGDGKINGKDYALLLQRLNGWDVELK